jgi:hypothetical protein
MSLIASPQTFSACHRTGGDDLVIDRPNEPGELAGHCGQGNGAKLSLARQRPIARTKTMLCLPSNLARRPRYRRDCSASSRRRGVDADTPMRNIVGIKPLIAAIMV